jgi:hypothetical protein
VQAATVSVIGLRHKLKGKNDDESADQQAVALFFIERRNLKIPATGNPCVLTAG